MEERRLELESWLISALGLRPKEESLLTFLNQSADDFVGLRLALERAAAPAAAAPGAGYDTGPMSPVGVYRCVRRTIVRESWESWSEKVGILEEGEEVKVLEERLNEEGVTRVRFTSAGVDLMGGWCSMRASDGSMILELTLKQYS